VPFRLFSGRSGDAIASNVSEVIGGEWVSFKAPTAVHFRGLSCSDNFDLIVESNSRQQDSIWENPLDESDPVADVSGITFDRDQDRSSTELQIFAVVVTILVGVAIVALRACFRNGKVVCIGKKRHQLAEGPNSAPLPRFQSFTPVFVQDQTESENPDQIVHVAKVIRVDPFHLDPDAQEVVDVPERLPEPDSPYDIVQIWKEDRETDE
jgi:hypothetical protein